ncbi:Acyl-CoA dehydrogenase, N-terminal domain/Acyl-CoA dehydrogenase, middle domain/Acyl-CoA dehydrogenase, C-terminal domain/Acetyl-CoA dehydrogenase C-terminal like, putative [Angomonas deanei]|uniref:Acyl-CoA dehydrogenase, N-terminal domain/Acyl-CoA dehydrogenase, middle domain/Acyl-CoA dehydrogenase, C-terminal domain/Acetyl-CoA dehydrogenase C-terminal like, putative n=1 Tax=Angomonas deanei TaxID=59799 RepID=A0A7G2CG82_9TRYP|nr:Acyl-CoA dehydrogenase, N-terminal domain/Acyl-CoA dehydrogenase, middle domain/Acyl-CoA dehydrogenase, C-terminal domain/Acetyl-CoA dehydrogenase C-terminal like, putative [Angomonas deanei]
MFRSLQRPSTLLFTGVSVRSLTYTTRTRDFRYLLEDVHGMYPHYEAIGVGDSVNKELLDTVMEEAAKVADKVSFPAYMEKEGCTLKDGNVITPAGYKETYRACVEGGWNGLNVPTEYGGQGLPTSVYYITKEMFTTVNYSLASYNTLTCGAIETLLHWGTEELKQQYVPKLVTGEWSGTMCLTEPHCGTDLAQVKTRAEKNADGTYRISGNKIFISAGEHDMTENIIHIVLARLPGSDPTTKGLSLFLVPRNVVGADGTLSKEKNVKCIAIEDKMGIKLSVTCQLSFENSVGYLIGKESEGMKEMFTFMNNARIGVAMQGIAHPEIAFQNALQYARERGSMRALSGAKCPEKPQDPIIYHPNVRHHVLFAKAVAEGGRAIVMEVGKMFDVMQTTQDKALRKKMDDEIAFLTPIAKGCLTEWGLEAAIRCQQVWGGHGYIKGNGMEQIVRDARIATIYEGTTAIQANDLIGRKVLSGKGGAGKDVFAARVAEISERLSGDKVLGGYAKRLGAAIKEWQESIPLLKKASAADADSMGAAAEDFLMYSGYIALSYYWLRMAEVSSKKIAAGEDADGFHQAKVDTCSYVFERVLPRAKTHYEVMLAPASSAKHEAWDLN